MCRKMLPAGKAAICEQKVCLTSDPAVARQVAIKIAAKAKDFSSKFPSIKISKDT